MDIIKTQSPLTIGGKGVYPLTTADQIVLSDGTRLEKNGYINAKNAVEANHSVEADHATTADNAINAENANEATHASTADDANALGGITASDYALKSDLGVSIELLWENDNAAAGLGATTIALNLSKYAAIMIDAVTHKSYSGYGITSVVFKNRRGLISYADGYSKSYAHREFTPDDNGITITTSYTNGAASNDYVIPYRIYGIKGVR